MFRTNSVLLIAVVGLAALFAVLPAQEPQPGEIAVGKTVKKRGGFLTVLDFGAKGDGVADDTAAIQELINAKAGSIRFPAGSYRISKPLVVELNKVGFTSFVADGSARLIMAGAGPAIRFVGTHLAGSADPGSVKPEVWERERMPTVEGLGIAGEHAEADGIEAIGTFQLTLRGVHIRKCRHGVRLVQRNRNILIDGCHIYENSGCGVLYDHVNLHQSNISASHISYCAGGGVVVRGGDVRNIHISGCDIEGNMSQNGPPTANVLLDCADGSVGEVAITGCTIQHAGAPDSANIRILGNAKVMRRGQPLAVKVGNVTIGDNVLSDVQKNIHLVGVRGATITGNTFWKAYEQNLLVEDSDHILVGPNMMERNPLYGYSSEGKDAVVLRNCRDCTIQGLHLHHVIDSEAGLTLEKCDRLHVTGCTILDCDNVGLLIKDCTRTRVRDNLVRDDRTGSTTIPIKVVGGSGNQIEER